MSIGMAVDSGGYDDKMKLAALLEDARVRAIAIGLYVNGAPFEILLAQVAQQVRAQATRERKQGIE